jgi:hypothetical protein
MFRLIKDAENKKPNKTLDRIIGIKQEISTKLQQGNNYIEITLQGIPIYK